MAISTDSIIDPTSTVPSNSEEAPKEADSSGIPEEVLALPIMAGLLNGAPPAVYTPVGSKSEEISIVLKHGKELNAAGFGFFRDEKNKLDVFYNSKFLDPKLIEAAAKKNKIPEVASDLATVTAQLNGAAGEAGGVTPTPSAGGMPSGAVLPDTPVNTARLGNLQPGAPTSGPMPGSGRILNSIVKPVI